MGTIDSTKSTNLELIVGEIKKERSLDSDGIIKINQIITMATKKEIAKTKINIEAKKEIKDILKDKNIDPELATSIISDKINSQETEEEFSYEEAEKIEKVYREQGMSDLYIITKMISLGYIPILHKDNFNNTFKGQKIKFIKDNRSYLAKGGPITNGTLNNDIFRKAQSSANEFILKKIFSELQQTKILLKQVEAIDISVMDRTQIDYKISILNELKTAIQSGNASDISRVSQNYNNYMTEYPAKLVNSLNDENFKSLGEKGEKMKTDGKEKIITKSEEIKSNVKGSIIKKLDIELEKINSEIEKTGELKNKISEIDDKIKELKEKKGDIDYLTNNKSKKEIELKEFKNQKLTSYENIGRNNKKNNNKEKLNYLNQEISKLESEIKKIDDEIKSTKKSFEAKKTKEIKTLETEKINFGNSSSVNTKSLEEKRKKVNSMKESLENKNYKKLKKQVELYKTDYPGNLDSLNKGNITYLQNDPLTKKTEEKVKNMEADIEKQTQKEIIDEKAKIPQAEIDRINNEIAEVDKKMNELKNTAARRLQEIDSKAKKHPEKIPEFKLEAEELVKSHNIEIRKLESVGIQNLSGLNAEQLKGVTQESKWLQNISKANGGIDWISSSKLGKILGVGAIMLIGTGIYDTAKKEGLKEAGIDALDLGLGIIPIAGGIYDIYRSFQGTDLNGKEMSSQEKLSRFGFGVLGLIPGIGTAVKWRAASGKIGKTIEGSFKFIKTGEVIIQGGNTLGKRARLSILGYTAVNTTYELIPDILKK